MKLYGTLALVAPFAALAVPAHAQDEQEGDWSVTVTPRYQHALFEPDPDADSFETAPTFGGTVTLRDPSAKFGITGTYLTGDADGTYTFDGNVDYDFEADREEFQLLFEFTPRQTGITFLAGYHRFESKYSEETVAGSPFIEIGDYQTSIDAFELGMRLASRLGANSRHAVTMQFLGGIGDSNGRATISQSAVGGTPLITEIDESGTGYTADFAIGYNYFISDRITIGTRLRGYVFDAKGTDVVYAITPEANLSFRF